jgi:archaellum biogenesis ATPase FlaH
MSVERDILAASCDSRAAYGSVVKYLGTDDLTDTGRMVWDVIEQYYARDIHAESINMETLGQLVEASVTNPKHKTTLGLVVEGMAGLDVSGLNVVSALVAVKREAVGAKLSTALLNGSEAQALMEEYAMLMDAETLEEEGEPEVDWGPNPEDYFEEDFEKDLIRMFPRSLNDRLGGGMMRGHHVIIFARPEMGKTSLLANFTAGFLQQGLRCLYLGNEDPIADVMLKFLGRVLQVEQQVVTADMAGAYKQAKEELNWGNLGMRQITPGTPWEIEQMVREFKPDVLMIDQLRNLQVRASKSDGMVQHLENAAKAVRTIGIRHNCLVLSVTQAGDSATGKAYLDMSDVDSSKTGIPAQAEVLLGLGASRDDEGAGRRTISLPKNKRTGRHEFFPVAVDFATCKFKSMEIAR